MTYRISKADNFVQNEVNKNTEQVITSFSKKYIYIYIVYLEIYPYPDLWPWEHKTITNGHKTNRMS